MDVLPINRYYIIIIIIMPDGKEGERDPPPPLVQPVGLFSQVALDRKLSRRGGGGGVQKMP